MRIWHVRLVFWPFDLRHLWSGNLGSSWVKQLRDLSCWHLLRWDWRIIVHKLSSRHFFYRCWGTTVERVCGVPCGECSIEYWLDLLHTLCRQLLRLYNWTNILQSMRQLFDIFYRRVKLPRALCRVFVHGQ